MNVLLTVQDPLVRDMIAMGFESVPGTQVVVASGPTAIERARQRRFDVVFVSHDPKLGDDGNALEQSARLREFDREVEVVVCADARWVKALTEKRDRLGPSAFLRVPVEPNEFFRLAVRLRSRRNHAAKPETSAR